MILTGQNISTRRKTCVSATCSSLISCLKYYIKINLMPHREQKPRDKPLSSVYVNSACLLWELYETQSGGCFGVLKGCGINFRLTVWCLELPSR
jgi:hypothetical protein